MENCLMEMECCCPAAGLFSGKIGMIVVMLISTLLILAFGIMAMRLRKGVVSTLNDAANGIIDKFVIPKDVASSSSVVSGGGGGGTVTGAVNTAANTVGNVANSGASVVKTVGLVSATAAGAGFVGSRAASSGASSGVAGVGSHPEVGTGDGTVTEGSAYNSFVEGNSGSETNMSSVGGDQSMMSSQSNQTLKDGSYVKSADATVGTVQSEGAAAGQSAVQAGNTGTATGAEVIDGQMISESQQEQLDKKAGMQLMNATSLGSTVSNSHVKDVQQVGGTGPQGGVTLEEAAAHQMQVRGVDGQVGAAGHAEAYATGEGAVVNGQNGTQVRGVQVDGNGQPVLVQNGGVAAVSGGAVPADAQIRGVQAQSGMTGPAGVAGQAGVGGQAGTAYAQADGGMADAQIRGVKVPVGAAGPAGMPGQSISGQPGSFGRDGQVVPGSGVYRNGVPGQNGMVYGQPGADGASVDAQIRGVKVPVGAAGPSGMPGQSISGQSGSFGRDGQVVPGSGVYRNGAPGQNGTVYGQPGANGVSADAQIRGVRVPAGTAGHAGMPGQGMDGQAGAFGRDGQMSSGSGMYRNGAPGRSGAPGQAGQAYAQANGHADAQLRGVRVPAGMAGPAGVGASGRGGMTGQPGASGAGSMRGVRVPAGASGAPGAPGASGMSGAFRNERVGYPGAGMRGTFGSAGSSGSVRENAEAQARNVRVSASMTGMPGVGFAGQNGQNGRSMESRTHTERMEREVQAGMVRNSYGNVPAGSRGVPGANGRGGMGGAGGQSGFGGQGGSSGAYVVPRQGSMAGQSARMRSDRHRPDVSGSPAGLDIGSGYVIPDGPMRNVQGEGGSLGVSGGQPGYFGKHPESAGSGTYRRRSQLQEADTDDSDFI